MALAEISAIHIHTEGHIMLSSISAVIMNGANQSDMQVTAGSASNNSGSTVTDVAVSDKSSAAITDTVSLSPETAHAIASGTNMPINGFNKYFPVRAGFTSTALSNAVTEPGIQTSSSGKNFNEVALDARARMDANYAAMSASGKPYDSNSWEGVDSAALMGELDRRSLYAVSSNTGGLFTQDEQSTAQSYMNQQQGMAMGLGGGPIRLAGEFNVTYGKTPTLTGDYASVGKAGVLFLDKVSNEEKSSVLWAMNRAGSQEAYESGMELMGRKPENLDSDIPLVKLIRAAMATMQNDSGRGMSTGSITNAAELKNQAWFKGFESQLDAALMETKSFLMGGH